MVKTPHGHGQIVLDHGPEEDLVQPDAPEHLVALLQAMVDKRILLRLLFKLNAK